jgi:hypothetical protein
MSSYLLLLYGGLCASFAWLGTMSDTIEQFTRLEVAVVVVALIGFAIIACIACIACAEAADLPSVFDDVDTKTKGDSNHE